MIEKETLIVFTAICVLVFVPCICCIGVFYDKRRRRLHDEAKAALEAQVEQRSSVNAGHDATGLLVNHNPLALGGIEVGSATYTPTVTKLDPVGDVTEFHSKLQFREALQQADDRAIVLVYTETTESLRAKQLANASLRKYEAVTAAVNEKTRRERDLEHFETEVQSRREELQVAVQRERDNQERSYTTNTVEGHLQVTNNIETTVGVPSSRAIPSPPEALQATRPVDMSLIASESAHNQQQLDVQQQQHHSMQHGDEDTTQNILLGTEEASKRKILKEEDKKALNDKISRLLAKRKQRQASKER